MQPVGQGRFRPSWRPREPPLEPVAVAAVGATISRLRARLLRFDDEALARLEGVAGPAVVLVLGPSESLPWVDGALWLGRDPSAPGLLLPTATEPSIAIDLYATVVRRRAGDVAGELAVLPRHGLLIPTGPARPLARSIVRSRLLADPPPRAR